MDIKTVNTILYCKKWDETAAFYKTKLKLKVCFSSEWFIEFKINEGSCLSIADEERASIGSSEGKGITITMRVNDINAAYLELTEAGLNPTNIKDHPWGAKVIYLYDPEGHRLEFWS
ncbi:MAG: VOC family protein [Desulfobacterales bacterium]|nr:VOC family protein [Desulfobacterales bacterium]